MNNKSHGIAKQVSHLQARDSAFQWDGSDLRPNRFRFRIHGIKFTFAESTLEFAGSELPFADPDSQFAISKSFVAESEARIVDS